MKKLLVEKCLPLTLLFVVSTLIVTALTPYGSATTPDSLSYLDIAYNIRNGKGVVSTDFSLKNIDRHSFIKQKLWPPLYPSLLSVVVSNSHDVVAVSYLSISLLFLSSMFIYLILVSCMAWYIALIPSLLFCMTLPTITVFTYAWSETLFIPLLIVCAWASIKYLTVNDNDWRWKSIYAISLLIALILLAYTRYIGVVFLLLLPFTYFMSKQNKYDRLYLLAALIACSGSFGYLLVDNYVSTASITGGERLASDKGLWMNMIDVLNVLRVIIPWSYPTIAVVFAFSVLVAYVKNRIPRAGHELENTAEKRALFILLFIGCLYSVSMILLRTHSLFDPLDVRLLSPAFPFFWMVSFILIQRCDVSRRSGLVLFMMLAVLVGSIAVAGYTRFNESVANWIEYSTPRLPMDRERVNNNFTLSTEANETRKAFSGLVHGDAVVLSMRPLIFEFILGVKNLQRPGVMDLETLQKINRLPEGSLLIAERGEEDLFAAANKDHEIIYEYVAYDNYVIIKIPVKISPR